MAHQHLYYIELIQRIHPDWSGPRCKNTAFQVLTLIPGGWITMGSSRPIQKRRGRRALCRTLLEGIDRLVEGT